MRKLHIGCGWRDLGRDWIHIDGGDYDHVDIKTDNLFELPFNSNTVDLIYSSHVIEYFDREEVKKLLNEWYRVLKNNGILRVAVPDFRVMSMLYSNTMEHLGLDLPSVELDDILGPMYGKMKMGDSYIYHKTVYDYMSLAKVLRDAGFIDIKHYNWKKTEHAKFDDHSTAHLPHDPIAIENRKFDNHILISLNVEAVK